MGFDKCRKELDRKTENYWRLSMGKREKSLKEVTRFRCISRQMRQVNRMMASWLFYLPLRLASPPYGISFRCVICLNQWSDRGSVPFQPETGSVRDGLSPFFFPLCHQSGLCQWGCSSTILSEVKQGWSTSGGNYDARSIDGRGKPQRQQTLESWLAH